MKLETHCHTKYSSDSRLRFCFLYWKCRICHINYIAITEHNNIKGAVKFKEYCEKRHSKIMVIIGEEIMTKSGEIIGLFLDKEIPENLSCKETIERIKAQDGVVYIPHPYDEKRNRTVLPEEKIRQCINDIDCIECHNGRNISMEYTRKQREIAEKYKATKVIGSDAHTMFEIGRNYMEIDICPVTPELFRKAIVNARFHEMKCLKICHQITKIVKFVRIVSEGNYSELYQTINKRIRGKKH